MLWTGVAMVMRGRRTLRPANRSPRLEHAVLLAHYLMRAGKQTEAGDVLTTALDDNRAAPRFIRRGNFLRAREAKRMLKECGEV